MRRVCAAAALTVTEPTSNGLGGDLFALVWDGRAVSALASSGASPRALDRSAVSGDRIPLKGWVPVTVPGQVAGWEALAQRFGRMDLERLLQPAVALARGFEVGPVTARAWAAAADRYRGPEFAAWQQTFLVDGSAPSAGQRFANPDLGASLAAIGRGGAAAFYTDLAAVIVEHARTTGGWLTARDFADHEVRWERPLSIPLRSAVHGQITAVGMGAPTQGVAALAALGLIEALAPPVTVHDRIEAIKLALADAYAAVSDPATAQIATERLIAPAHLDRRRHRLDRDRAGPSPAPPDLPAGGTVLVCTGDDEGRLCSLIQSNFHGFGSGVVVPGTGIALQNRGAGFSLEPGHPNALAGGSGRSTPSSRGCSSTGRAREWRRSAAWAGRCRRRGTCSSSVPSPPGSIRRRRSMPRGGAGSTRGPWRWRSASIPLSRPISRGGGTICGWIGRRASSEALRW